MESTAIVTLVGGRARCNGGINMSDRTQPLRRRIAQLEAEVQALRKRDQNQP